MNLSNTSRVINVELPLSRNDKNSFKQFLDPDILMRLPKFSATSLCKDTSLVKKNHEDSISSFCVKLLTDKTDKETK